jgi:hypothetical protein
VQPLMGGRIFHGAYFMQVPLLYCNRPGLSACLYIEELFGVYLRQQLRLVKSIRKKRLAREGLR